MLGEPAAASSSQDGHTEAEALGPCLAASVFKAFAALPKTGKPQAHEFTVLAGTNERKAIRNRWSPGL